MLKIYLSIVSFFNKLRPDWSVIMTDNYSRSGELPCFDEVFIKTGLTHRAATKLAEERNTLESGDWYYRVVYKGYKLARFEDWI